MSTVDDLHRELDKRSIKWFMNQNGVTIFTSPVLGRVLVWESALGEGLILDAGYVSKTLEQVIEATLGKEPWEPSEEWKAWHASLRHDNPTNVREVVESILFDAIEFGGDMGPNGNVWNGVDEGAVLTDGCINGWVKSIEEIAATTGKTCRNTSKWANVFKCSECGFEYDFITDPYQGPRHCPNCGARIEAE